MVINTTISTIMTTIMTIQADVSPVPRRQHYSITTGTECIFDTHPTGVCPNKRMTRRQ